MSASISQSKSGFKSIYRVSDAQPNWAQTDPSQPDYIRNRDLAQEVRPIKVNGESFLSNDVDSGEVNFVAGGNIILTPQGNSIIISSTGGGTSDSATSFIEGEGIDITRNTYGQFVVSIEHGSINDKHIGSISASKLVQDKENVLILNGGNANG